jgi:hypothetical protein
MQKRSRMPRDPNQRAKATVDIVDTILGDREPEPERVKNPAAVALGKLGGVKGGKARAAKLSPEQRREIAQRAARARWGQSGS